MVGKQPIDHDVRQFTLNGNSGSWSGSAPPVNSLFKPVRTAGGYGAFDDAHGYILSGLTTPQNDLIWTPYDGGGGVNLSTVPGLLTYNMVNKTWSNNSVPWLEASTGAAAFGRMQYVPNFGPKGVLIVLGGERGSVDLTWEGDGFFSLGMDLVNVYDISSKTWYSQRATGSTSDAIPSKRNLFCIAGADSGNGTYQIYLYGGESGNHYWTEKSSDQAALNTTNARKTGVHALSLPGFVWFKSNDTSAAPRSGHACVRAGNRQMISVGGVDSTVDVSNKAFLQEDPNTYGLGVFDMVDLKWKDSYDADADPYVAPEAIQSWYAGNR